MQSARNQRLGQVPLLAGLTSGEIQALSQRCLERRYNAGETLFIEGEDCQGIYLIIEGSVKIFKTSSSGREVTLAIESAPSSVAEVPLFDGGPYPASVTALEPVVAAFIGTRDFQQVCSHHPAVALKILGAAGKRLRQLVGLIELVTFGSVRQRLASLLLELSAGAQSERFPLAMTHQELASRLGTVREVVSRNLSRFQAEGLLRIAGKEIHLLNRDGLVQEAETEL